MTKVAILGDTHFGARNDSVVFHDYFEKFYSQVFFPYLKDQKITTIIQAGDLFDKKKNVNFLTLDRANKYFFHPLFQNGMKLVVLAGNHDTYFKNENTINAPRLLLEWFEHVTVVDEPRNLTIHDTKFLLLPWICRDNEEKSMDLIRMTNALYAVGHLEVEGFSMYKGGKSSDHGLKLSEFDRFDHVFSGHYHHRSRKGNVQYTGTPYELTWSDFDDQKGFHVLDLDTGEVEFVKNPFSIFQKIEYDDAGKTLEQITAEVDQYRDAFVKVVVTNKTNAYHFDAFVKGLEDNGTSDVKIIQNALALELNEEELEEVEATEEILKRVVLDTETGVAKEKLDRLLLELYNEANSLEIS